MSERQVLVWAVVLSECVVAFGMGIVRVAVVCKKIQLVPCLLGYTNRTLRHKRLVLFPGICLRKSVFAVTVVTITVTGHAPNK